MDYFIRKEATVTSEEFAQIVVLEGGRVVEEGSQN